MLVETEVAQHHATAEEEGGRVCLILALDVKTDVAAAGLEDGDIPPHVTPGHDARTPDESSANVGQDAAIQVGHDHDVELLRPRDTLHAGIVDNHVVGLERRVLLCDALEGVAEKPVGELHDVGLVDAGDLLAVVGQGEGKGKLCDALRLCARDDLERFDHAADGLVLEPRVLALGVLTDDAEVDVLVTSVVARDVLDEHNGRVDVELLS